MTPKIGLALIAKNEATRLPNLLTSVSRCFDYVALVDTGSTDKTVEELTKLEIVQIIVLLTIEVLPDLIQVLAINKPCSAHCSSHFNYEQQACAPYRLSSAAGPPE